MIGMTRPKAKDRPRGKPFDEPERKYLCSLDIIDACTEKRITWNKPSSNTPKRNSKQAPDRLTFSVERESDRNSSDGNA